MYWKPCGDHNVQAYAPPRLNTIIKLPFQLAMVSMVKVCPITPLVACMNWRLEKHGHGKMSDKGIGALLFCGGLC